MMEQQFEPDRISKDIYGDGIIHLVASGWHETFCGLDARTVKHTSIGACCNCHECLVKAQEMLDKKLMNESMEADR